MGVVAAQRSSRAAKPVVRRYQESVARRNSAALFVKRRDERDAQAASCRAVPYEIFSGGQLDRRLLRVEAGNPGNGFVCNEIYSYCNKFVAK